MSHRRYTCRAVLLTRSCIDSKCLAWPSQEEDICAVFEVDSLPAALARPDAVAVLHKSLRDCVDLMGVGSGAPRGPRDTVAEDTAAVAHAVLDGKDLGDVRCCSYILFVETGRSAGIRVAHRKAACQRLCGVFSTVGLVSHDVIGYSPMLDR